MELKAGRSDVALSDRFDTHRRRLEGLGMKAQCDVTRAGSGLRD